jgi:hypothetical protein
MFNFFDCSVFQYQIICQHVLFREMSCAIIGYIFEFPIH